MNEQPPPVPVIKTSVLAIASLVLGILSFFCLGFLTGIPALILGVIALVKIGKSVGTLKGQGLAIAGLCTGGIGMLVGTAMLAALLLPMVIQKRMTVSKESPTAVEVKMFSQALEQYTIDNGAYPTTAQGLQALVARPTNCPNWNGPYFKSDKFPNDRWGHPYVYRCPGVKVPAGFDLLSVGPDGKEGTADDIGNW